MVQQSRDEEELKQAARRSSDAMSAFAARRHAGENPADYRQAQRADRAAMRSGARDDVGKAGGSGGARDRQRPIRVQSDESRRRQGGSSERRRTDPGKGRHAQQSQRYPKTLVEFISQNSMFITGVSAVVVVVVIIIGVLKVTLPPKDTGDVASGGAAQVEGELSAEAEDAAGAAQQDGMSYDWGNLEYADGRYAYVVDGQVKSRLGIDISDHQPGTDWDAVAADGIDFAIVRLGYRGATEGVIHLDEQYETNVDGALAAGLDCGVYFFSQAITTDEAVEEADFVIKSLDGRNLSYPVVFDFETGVNGIEHPRTEKLSPEQLVAIAEAFCKHVEEAGYSTMVYGNGFDLARYTSEYLEGRPIWWAEYGPQSPSYGGSIAMWQYTSGGEVAGVNGGADMSIDLRGASGR